LDKLWLQPLLFPSNFKLCGFIRVYDGLNELLSVWQFMLLIGEEYDMGVVFIG
jgi:hypothetical protein